MNKKNENLDFFHAFLWMKYADEFEFVPASQTNWNPWSRFTFRVLVSTTPKALKFPNHLGIQWAFKTVREQASIHDTVVKL